MSVSKAKQGMLILCGENSIAEILAFKNVHSSAGLESGVIVFH